MRWCDPAVDRLEAQALVSTDTAARRALYGSIARRVAASVPIVFLFNARYVYAHRARLGGFEPDAFLPTWNAADWFTGSTQEIYRSTASGSREQESR
jgi:ABC-type transport system substrate-binding protein